MLHSAVRTCLSLGLIRSSMSHEVGGPFRDEAGTRFRAHGGSTLFLQPHLYQMRWRTAVKLHGLQLHT